MARRHVKEGFDWTAIADIKYARGYSAPVAKRVRILCRLDRAADARLAATLPSQYTQIDGFPPRTAYVQHARKAIANARRIREDA